MTTANNPLKSIESRIDELEQTISERGEQIKTRANRLKDELRDELAPLEIIKKHPLEASGIAFVTGILAGRSFKALTGPKRRRPATEQRPTVIPQPPPATQPTRATTTTPQEHHEHGASPAGIAIGAIGIELINVFKDLGISWLKNRFDQKNRENKQN